MTEPAEIFDLDAWLEHEQAAAMDTNIWDAFTDDPTEDHVPQLAIEVEPRAVYQSEAPRHAMSDHANDPKLIWAADLEQERACQEAKLIAGLGYSAGIVTEWQHQEYAMCYGVWENSSAINPPAELIECADGKKRTQADKDAWEQHIWEQLRQVQG